MLDALPAEGPARPDLAPLLRHLVSVGLATEERTGPEDENPNLTCHELVRERIRAWMEQRPQDQAELTENTIRLAYAERLEAVFKALQHQNMTAALAGGQPRARLLRAGRSVGPAGQFRRDGHQLARSAPVGGTDPASPDRRRVHARGQARWRASATSPMRLGRRPPRCEPAVLRAGRRPSPRRRRGRRRRLSTGWSDVAWITGNWANALVEVGNLDAARQRHLEAAEADRKAGSPAIDVIGQRAGGPAH